MEFLMTSVPQCFMWEHSLMLGFPMISMVLADSLGMWDMGPDAGDSDVKPLPKPEPLQTSATPVLKNQMVTWERTPQNLCHQNPQAKSGLSHLQTHINQDVTGSKVFRNKNRKNLGLNLCILKEEWHCILRSWVVSCQRNSSLRNDSWFMSHNFSFAGLTREVWPLVTLDSSGKFNHELTSELFLIKVGPSCLVIAAWSGVNRRVCPPNNFHSLAF